MAKHLGEPPARRTAKPSRGFAWGIAGFLTLNVVAVLAVVQGIGSHHAPVDVISAAAHDTPRDGAAGTGSTASAKSAGRTADPGSTKVPSKGSGTGLDTGSGKGLDTGSGKGPGKGPGKGKDTRAQPVRHAGSSSGPARIRQLPYRRVTGSVLQIRPEVAHRRWQVRQPTVFRVSTFNVLGASHTGLGGNHKGFATGARRMGSAVALLRSFQVDVVGFQEMETVQWSTFNRLTGNGWGSYPGPTLDRGSIRQSIAWRRDTWQLVSASSIPIPYFQGQLIRMPIVLLSNIRTGQQVFFTNFHNPATTSNHGNNQRWRFVAEAKQVGMVRSLEAAHPGTPVIVTGDMNERAEYFAHLAGQTDMCAANSAVTSTGGCFMPRRMDVDWIFGSHEIFFSGFVSDQGPFVRRTSDHPIVVATGTLAPAIDRR